jgi:DNA-directed DNA polymerase III PolC
LLSGASSVESLVDLAVEWGLPALALTDENNLYGAVPFLERARERGLRPILGAILDGRDGGAVLLVENRTGYANLCTLISLRRLGEEFTLAEELPRRQRGLVILTPQVALAEALAGRLDRGRLWLELLRPGPGLNDQRRLLRTARRLGLGVVASCDAFFARAEDFELHEALVAVRENALLDEVRPKVAGRREARLRPPAEMARLFADVPEALTAVRRIAERCEFDLLGLETVFPRLPGDSVGRLRTAAQEGARWRYQRVAGPVRRRLERELELIARKGFADYFLVVADIVRHARSLGTPVAGRGSGASSLIAYCLGVTNVDPLALDLPFERFLNEGRRDYPDLDIDFCWRLRDEVIDYVYRRYGEDHVAMIATYATMQPRLAFREVGKILGMSNPLITRVERRLRSGGGNLGGLPVEKRVVERALRLARRLEGFPHHLSVHCGGVVVTPGPISAHAPLERAQKGVVVTQYDKDGVEAVGLVKLDLLGNRALSSTGEAVRALRARGAKLDPEELPEGDAKTARLLARAGTVGVNQLESPAMRHLLAQLRPRGVRDLMRVLALIRPGAASLGMKDEFVRRARGLAPVPRTDARLDRILGGTFGIMLYEDDVLLVARALTGLDAAGADRFRRAVTKCRSDAERLELSREFIARCRANGVDPELAAGLWVQMAKFNSYSFCRAHAASYARLAWAGAYLKAHHPEEFWLGALNNNASMYPTWVYLEEARRSGVGVLLPCVNRSGKEFSLEDGAVRTGLGRVRGLSERSIASILRGRPYADLADFLARAGVRLGEAESLVRCGALDFTDRTRPDALLELFTSFPSARRLPGARGLFGCSPAPAVAEPLEDYAPIRKVRDEWELLELWVRRHPLAGLSETLRRMGATGSAHLAKHVGRRVRAVGLAAAGRTTRSESGKLMGFLSLSDAEGLFEVTLFPDVFRRARRLLAYEGLGPFVVEGRVEEQYGALSVIAVGLSVLQSSISLSGTGSVSSRSEKANRRCRSRSR